MKLLSQPKPGDKKAGMTLVELLIVLAITSLLLVGVIEGFRRVLGRMQRVEQRSEQDMILYSVCKIISDDLRGAVVDPEKGIKLQFGEGDEAILKMITVKDAIFRYGEKPLGAARVTYFLREEKHERKVSVSLYRKEQSLDGSREMVSRVAMGLSGVLLEPDYGSADKSVARPEQVKMTLQPDRGDAYTMSVWMR